MTTVMSKGLLAGIVVVVAAVGVGAYLAIPKGPPPPEVVTVQLEAREFGYQGLGYNLADHQYKGGPTIKVKVGDTVRIVLKNSGGTEHELMVVKDKEKVLNMMRGVIKDLQAQSLEKSKAIEQYNEKHEANAEKMVAFPEAEVDVEQGQTKTIEFTANTVGQFSYVCHKVAGTYPETHQDNGMFGEFIVEG